MKNIGHIYLKDLKNIGTNWVVMILIGGLIILPSLYAWFNIKASWDPYGQTDQIPVGIVNDDAGADLRGTRIEAGDEIVQSLKKNKAMDWKFVDRKTAMDKIDQGEYFSVIVIPKDFSKNLATVLDKQPKKAKVEYYVNEKINAIAPKITGKGASVIVNEVSSKFVGTVNGTIFDMFNELGIELENDLPDIKRFENYLFTIKKDLPSLHDSLTSTINDANDAEQLLNDAKAKIPTAKQATANGLDMINETIDYLNEAERRFDELSPQIKKDLNHAAQISSDVNAFLDDLKSTKLDFSDAEKVANTLNEEIIKNQSNLQAVEDVLRTVQNQLKELKPEVSVPKVNQGTDGNTNVAEQNPAPQVKVDLTEVGKNVQSSINQVQALQEKLSLMQSKLSEVRGLPKGKEKVQQTFNKIQDVSIATTEKINSFINEYQNEIEPHIRKQLKTARTTLNQGKDILLEVQQSIPKVEKLIANTETHLHDGQKMLDRVLKEYPYIQGKTKELADKVRKIQDETDIDEIINLLQNDPEAESGFFQEPVQLKEHKLYPIPNYGSGMAPFYTTLAVWVGGLLLISLLSVEVKGERKFKAYEQYFGRYLTFMTIGFMQSIIVSLGNIWILDVYVKEPIWFIVFTIFTSFVFMTIVYTLVSVFGDVGKALAIVLLVLQLAGSGGTYPVALLPSFFQAIHPYLPFTYGVDLLREAVGGIVWSHVAKDLITLVIFAGAIMLVGIFLKKPINKKQEVLVRKSKESGLFH